jgi:hypothetical protein
MSLANAPPPQREFRLSQNVDKSYIEHLADQTARLSASEPLDGSVLDDIYSLTTTGGQKTPQPAVMDAAPPALPARNALRASRLLDNLGLKLGGSLDSTDVPAGQSTPHDFYLSSEEDASSSADDFSDYDYESASEGLPSPIPRRSREITARVVSVVYVGKPSLVDVSTPPSRRQSCVGTAPSSRGSMNSRPSTSSTTHQPFQNQQPFQQPPPKTSSGFSLAAKRGRPPSFLSIDPYANGSTYSLELPAEPAEVKPPRTPTKLLKGVSRTLSVMRRRSRPNLLNELAALESPSWDAMTGNSFTPAVAEPPRTPASPVTYNDILRAARKNAAEQESARRASIIPTPSEPSPVSPEGKKGFLETLAARRRSIKIVNGRLLH